MENSEEMQKFKEESFKREEILDKYLSGYPWQYNSKENVLKAMEAYHVYQSSKPNWKNVKKELPENGKSVIKYTSEINSSQQRMYVTICEGDVLKHSDESVWWIDIPELPVPLKID